MSHKIATINLSPRKKADTVSDIFIAQPDMIKESLAGKLFILVEISGNKTNRVKILNFLIDKINQNYYQNESIILRERITSLKVEHIFETSLSKTNTDFSDWLSAEKISRKGLDISIVAGVIYENELYFASQGGARVFLIYKKNQLPRDRNIPPEDKERLYKITELTRNTDDLGGGKPESSKLFSNVLSGQIPDSSCFVITNETLPEYISQKRMIQITTTLAPRGAAEQIKNTLSSLNSYVTFLGVIIKSVSLDSGSTKEQSSERSAQESIVDLNRTEDQTEDLLAPSGTLSFKKWLTPLLAAFKRKDKSTSDTTIVLKDRIYAKKKSGKNVEISFAFVKNIYSSIINVFFFLFKTLTQKGQSKLFFSGIKSLAANNFKKYTHKILLLNKRSKILLMIAIISLIIFLAITGFNRTQTRKEEAEKNYQAMIELIEKKQNQAEASLLYSNEVGAKKLFDEITALMSDLPQVTDEQKERYKNFKNMLDAQLETTRRVVRIDDAKELANFTNLNIEARPGNIIHVAEENKILAADSKEKSIYIYDSPSQLVSSVTDLELEITGLFYPAIINENNILYYNNGSIISYLLGQESLINLSITLSNAENDIVGADTYNNRLYILDRKNSMIYRYNKTGNEFSSPYSWLSENVDLTEAVGMAIDGHIYILNKNGQMLKFLRGQVLDFRLEAIDPPLSQASGLAVSPEQSFLYVLEPEENRLIVYDKTGQFILQYKSDKFNDLKDFAVDEENRTIYILNATSLYSFDAIHFEE